MTGQTSFCQETLVFDEFFMFLVGVRRLKEHREDKHSAYVIKGVGGGAAFQVLPALCPYTGAQEGA